VEQKVGTEVGDSALPTMAHSYEQEVGEAIGVAGAGAGADVGIDDVEDNGVGYDSLDLVKAESDDLVVV
tara:strand:+ start:188 stop:394 length:207 start_codon:yes stop_codon:yes gene_type:complete